MPTLYRVAFERTRLDGRIDRGSFTGVLIVPRRGLAVGGRNEHDDKADRAYLADPSVGSKHNRGCAVDLTLYDLKTGMAVRMPSLYDEASPRASPDYPGGTAKQRALRDLLHRAMEAEDSSWNPWSGGTSTIGTGSPTPCRTSRLRRWDND
jgi:hypothetical protein